MAVSGPVESLGVIGVPVTMFESYDHAVECIVERTGRREKTFCVAINPEKIFRSQSDGELRRLIGSADFHLCDGIGVALAAAILYRRKVGRITGVQLFLELMTSAESNRLRVFLLGASPESNRGAYERLRKEYPKLAIAGRRDGYFNDDAEVVEEINRSRPDMLFVAMGSPRQEKWIVKHREQIEAPYCMGVGGTFDVLSGRAKWAPRIIRRMGLEFLYRLIKEPKRWRRQLVLPRFAMMVFKQEFLGLWRRSEESPILSFPGRGPHSGEEPAAKAIPRPSASQTTDDRRDAA
jgi:N-acetylglucosaminyldiphosphoundecaprenol N-acetyl-beta-D-mannosaminyltransferase